MLTPVSKPQGGVRQPPRHTWQQWQAACANACACSSTRLQVDVTAYVDMSARMQALGARAAWTTRCGRPYTLSLKSFAWLRVRALIYLKLEAEPRVCMQGPRARAAWTTRPARAARAAPATSRRPPWSIWVCGTPLLDIIAECSSLHHCNPGSVSRACISSCQMCLIARLAIPAGFPSRS